MKISDILKNVTASQQQAHQRNQRTYEERRAKADELRRQADLEEKAAIVEEQKAQFPPFMLAPSQWAPDGVKFVDRLDQEMRDRWGSPGAIDNPMHDPWKPVQRNQDPSAIVAADPASGPDESVISVHRAGGELVPGPHGAGKLLNATVFANRLIGAFERGVYILDPDGWRRLDFGESAVKARKP